MKKLLACCLGVVMMAVPIFAQCQTPNLPATPAPFKATIPPAVQSVPAPVQYELTSSPEELNFLANGPRLYPMDKAVELSKATGKPVVCWMGKHLFSDPRARDLSNRLKDTTIQAAMDGDGTAYDRVGPRLKFSSTNYADDAKTYYVKLANFDKDGQAERVLHLARGGGR